MDLVSFKDDVISTECQAWDFENPAFDLVEFVDTLAKVMLNEFGIGISANQVGEPYKVFLIAGGEGPHTVKPFVNAKIVDFSEESNFLEEGCLTYPGLAIKIKRPRTIKIRYSDATGETRTDKFTGMTARIIQHELDHGEGITMFDRATTLHKEKAKKEWKKIQKSLTQS